MQRPPHLTADWTSVLLGAPPRGPSEQSPAPIWSRVPNLEVKRRRSRPVRSFARSPGIPRDGVGPDHRGSEARERACLGPGHVSWLCGLPTAQPVGWREEQGLRRRGRSEVSGPSRVLAVPGQRARWLWPERGSGAGSSVKMRAVPSDPSSKGPEPELWAWLLSWGSSRRQEGE